MERQILKPKCSAFCTITHLSKIHRGSFGHLASQRAFTGHWKNARNSGSIRREKTITSNTSQIKQSGMKSSSWRTKRIRCTSCACLKKRTGKVLHPHWTTAKVDAAGLGQLLKTRQQMNELGYAPDPASAVMHFLTARLNSKDISDMQKLIPRRDLVTAWLDLEDHAKGLAKRLTSKEAATPSRTWKLLSEARPEMTLFLAVTA